MKTNDQKITKEFCQGKTLLFFPKTEGEANFIFRKCVEFEFQGLGGGLTNPAQCVATGLALKGAQLFYFDANKDINGIVCTIDQFDEKYLSPEMAFVLEQFNKLSAKVDAIYEELRPAKLDKPVFKKPDSSP